MPPAPGGVYNSRRVGNTPPTQGEEAMLELTDANFDAEVNGSDVPVLVDFWAPWCAPCLIVAPVVEEIAQEHAGSLKVGKVNVDENPQTAAQFGIRSIPTLMIFKGGRPVDMIIGAVPKQHIEAKLAPHMSG